MRLDTSCVCILKFTAESQVRKSEHAITQYRHLVYVTGWQNLSNECNAVHCNKCKHKKQKPVRELAYSEPKLELLHRCNIIHYVLSPGLKGSTSNCTQDVHLLILSSNHKFLITAYSCHGNQGVPWDSLVDCIPALV